MKISSNNTTNVLQLQNPRTIYRESKEEVITIIEIIPSDNIDTNSFLEFDLNIFQNEFIDKYINKLVLLIKFQKEENHELLQRKIKNINSDKYEIEKFHL